jgi:uridine kinase
VRKNESEVRLVSPRRNAQVTLPDKRTFEALVNTTVEKFFQTIYPNPAVPYMAALVDGTLRELSYRINRDCTLEPIDLSQSDGGRIYRRSLTFLMVVAAQHIFPGVEVFVDHSLPFGGYFCELHNRDPFTETQLTLLKQEMLRLVESDLPIVREDEVPLEDVLNIFRERGEFDKVGILQGRDRKNKAYLRLYNLNGYRDYFHGYMIPSTGYLRFFDLQYWDDGFILQFPRRHEPNRLLTPSRSPQLKTVFREYGHWLRLLGTEDVGRLNKAIENKKIREVILVAEALHEHRIADIAHQIWEKRSAVRLALIAGPSSSGKTTFSKRLAVQLLAHGLRPFALELDNYFVNREDTPRDENGEYNFEVIEALDLNLFNTHLNALMKGDEVQLPTFNFYSGKREPGKVTRLTEDQVIIVEGIHGLNPRLVYDVPEETLFRIYVSALTQLNLDRHNRVPTTDTRLIRRIIRDARTRGYTAKETINRWESVRRGEKRHIFPHQEYADVMFNSALVYELSVLKPFAEPLLLQVNRNSRQWVEANRLLTFLQWFQPLKPDIVPENSILREFVGGLALEEFRWD